MWLSLQFFLMPIQGQVEGNLLPNSFDKTLLKNVTKLT